MTQLMVHKLLAAIGGLAAAGPDETVVARLEAVLCAQAEEYQRFYEQKYQELKKREANGHITGDPRDPE